MKRVLVRAVSIAALIALLVGIGAVPAFASVGVSLESAPRSFSPNGDGQEDTISVEYYLSEASNVEIDVNDASNNTVRVLQPSVSLAAGYNDVRWDGEDTTGAVVPDGAYTLVFTATGPDGTASATYDTAVDTRLPGMLTSPHPGATLSGVQSFVFTPTAGFSGINRVSVDCIGEADAPAGDGTFTASGDTSTTCNDGPHTIAAHLSFTDEFGATHEWDSPGFSVTVQQPVRVQLETYPSPSAETFSPNGDGQDDTVTGGYCLSRTAMVSIVVENASDTVVRTLQPSTSIDADGATYSSYCEYTGPPGHEGFTWDGKSDAGAVVPDGNYSIVIDAQDAQGNTASATYETAVDTRVPGTLTVPAAGATLSKDTSFVFTPTAGFTGIDSVSVDCVGAGTLQGDGTWTGSGDAPTNCPPSTTGISATVRYTDQFGVSHSWQSPATPTTLGVQLVAKSSPRSFSPNGDGQEDTLTSSYCLTQDATLTITVHDAADNLVRTLESNVAHAGAWPCSPYYDWDTTSWDGRDQAGDVVADGDYTIDIHAVDDNGNTDDLSIPTTVDTRAPGTLTVPASGATLTGTANFVFTPTAGFTGISSMYVDCLGYGTLQGDGTWTGSGDTRSCAQNTTSLAAHVTYTDKYGSTHTWDSPATPVTIAIQLTRPPYWYYASRSFSPNGDGQEDSVAAYYCMTGDATVTITIHDGAHDLVRTVQSGVAEAASPCGNSYPYDFSPNTVTWDGRDDHGDVVADGDYTIDIHAVDGNGNVADLSIPTTVDTRAPGTLTGPAPGATLTGTANFVFTPTPGFNGITSVDVDCIGSGSLQGDGTWTGSGDTSTCANGFVNLDTTVSWIDGYGSTHTWVSPAGVPVTIDNVSLSDGSGSTSFSPNGDGHEDTITVSYCLEEDATVTITVRDTADAVVQTLESNVAHVAVPNCSYYYNKDTTTWDGRDDAGDVVADGNYTIDVHAVTTVGSATGDLSIPVTVDNRAPGTLTAPSFGDTLQGTINFTFTPATGFEGSGQNTIESLYGCFSNDSSTNEACVSILNPSPDGIWRTTLPTSDLANGAADFSWSVTYADPYGVQHVWSAPVPVAVSINTNPDPVIAMGASPSNGYAPLPTTVHFDLSDSGNRPLAYSANFGDGSSAVTGTAISPYTGGISLPHTYQLPGSYLATVSVSDGAGGSVQKSVTITVLGTEQPPTATLAVTPTAGIAPTPVTATFSATDPDSPTLTYTLDFGDGTTPTAGTLAVGPNSLGHTYAQPGIYTVRLAVSDGTYTDVHAQAVSVGLSGPLTASAGDDQTATVNQSVHFDGSNSRPLVGITSYGWNFGDGNTGTGAEADHTYTTTGTKTVTLAVHAGTKVSTDSITVDVLPVPTTPGLHVTVTGSSALIGGADVAVIDSAGTRFAATTNDTGVATINGLPDGNYTVYASHDGFLPGTATATTTNGSGNTSIDLAAGSVGQTSMTSEPITDPAVLLADGIDPNDPANQNIYKFDIHLAFIAGGTNTDLSFGGFTTSGSGGGGGGGGGGGFLQPTVGGGTGGGPGCVAGAECISIPGAGGGYLAYPEVIYKDASPTILWMIIPGQAKWLKEFFDVSVVVTNLASSPFSFQHGTVSLANLPAGLSLAPTAVPQSLAQTLPDVPGGQSAEATWVVRGDTEGFYTLTAQYSGTLEPTGTSVILNAATAPNALHVWGGSALHLIVDADGASVTGAPYRIRIGMQNVADVPMFNPGVELLEAGRVNYIYQPGEILTDGTAVIQPGATYYTHYFRLIPEISGTLVPSLSFVKQTGGNVTGVTNSIVEHAAVAGLNVTGTHQGSALKLSWSAPPVTGITGYRVYFTSSRNTPFGANPIAMTTSGTRTVTFAHPSVGYYAISTLVHGIPTMFHSLFGPPSPPTAPVALDGNNSATVTWSASAANGGAPITSYVVTPIRSGSPQPARTLPASAGSTSFTGLGNGATSTFSIVAKNANGSSASAVTAAIIIGAPGRPTNVGLIKLSTTSLKILFTAPANNGAPITSYSASCTSTNGGTTKTKTGTTSPITVAGLTAGKTYSCTVKATNSRGTGPPSAASASVIP